MQVLYGLNEEIFQMQRCEKPPRLYTCPKCGKSYTYTFTLQRHLKYECGKEPGFFCIYCPHRTKRKSNLHEHVKHVHPSKPFNYAQTPEPFTLD